VLSGDKEFNGIEPADGIPERKFRQRDYTYDKIISEFIESGLTIAKIKPIPGKFPRSVYNSLRARLVEGNHPIAVSIRGEDIYLKQNKK
jgi:hypothetical protein